MAPKLNLVSVRGVVYNMNNCSDDRLKILLYTTENDSANWPLMRSFPDKGLHILQQQDKILKELHSRSLMLCLCEMQALYRFKLTKKFYVVRWLNGIDLNDITEYKYVLAEEEAQRRKRETEQPNPSL